MSFGPQLQLLGLWQGLATCANTPCVQSDTNCTVYNCVERLCFLLHKAHKLRFTIAKQRLLPEEPCQIAQMMTISKLYQAHRCAVYIQYDTQRGGSWLFTASTLYEHQPVGHTQWYTSRWNCALKAHNNEVVVLLWHTREKMQSLPRRAQPLQGRVPLQRRLRRAHSSHVKRFPPSCATCALAGRHGPVTTSIWNMHRVRIGSHARCLATSPAARDLPGPYGNTH